MNNTHNTTKPSLLHKGLLYTVPAVLFCMLTGMLWPFMRYYVDIDALSYLNITAKYLAGDYQHAINAFWSPMGCWLTAIFAKITGQALFTSAIIVNTISVAGLLISCQCLFNKFRQNALERWCFGLMMSCFWSYAVYFQSFTDFWQYFFLTVGLLILLSERFINQGYKWILLGILAALAYFSKAYSFFFFPLMIFIATTIRLRQESGPFQWKRLVLICGTAVVIMLLISAPWLYLLHEKYGFWTNSTAGKLNSSWWLVGTQEFRPDIKVVVPPPYKGSLYYFEDPYVAQGPMAHFYDSPRLFLKQVLRVAYNSLGWVTTSNRISPFFFLTWLITILFLFRKNIRNSIPPGLKIITAIYLVYPLPFWLFTFEGGRYTWFIIPMGAILSMLYAERAFLSRWSNRYRNIFIMVFFFSYVVSPVLDLKSMVGKGKKEYLMAQELKKRGIQGSFITNRSYSDGFLSVGQLSWFSQNPWYCHTLSQYSTAQLEEDARRYSVKYYFYFYDGSGDDYQLIGLDGRPKADLTGNSIEGLKVFSLEY